jgi:hypothetical protein
MLPPEYVGGATRPNTSRSPARWNEKLPPLLQTYAAPSGPMAAPFGPPPSSAIRSTLPSGDTFASVPAAISVTRTDPSAMAIGPSGNSSPVAMIRTSAVGELTDVAVVMIEFS